MSVVDDYLASQTGHEKTTLQHMYGIVRRIAPDATEELSYGMPAFKYRGKGLVAVVVNKEDMSLYPFCSLDRLGLDFSSFLTTKGSLHFNLDKPIPDELLRQIVTARVKLITA